MIGKNGMPRSAVSYSKNYRYQLECVAYFDTPLRPLNAIFTDYVTLLPCGQLIIAKGYAWNGPNFPAIHTQRSILASLPHDAMYQLISRGLLDEDEYRRLADVVLEALVSEPGKDRLLNILRKIRGTYYYLGVDLFGSKAARRKTVIYRIE